MSIYMASWCPCHAARCTAVRPVSLAAPTVPCRATVDATRRSQQLRCPCRALRCSGVLPLWFTRRSAPPPEWTTICHTDGCEILHQLMVYRFIPLFIGFQPSTVSVICVISFIQYSTPYIRLGCVEMSLARHIRMHAKQNMERKFEEFVLNPTADFCFSCEIMWRDICHRVPAPWSSSSTTCK